MFSISVAAALAALDTAAEAVGALDWDAMSASDRLAVLDRLESAARRQTATAHDIVNSLDRTDDGQLRPLLPKVIADVLRISPAEARRRVRDSAQLGTRTALTGQQLPPELPATAKAWRAGLLDRDHVQVIQKFFKALPDSISPADAEKAETFLAEKAGELRPDQLEKVADKLAVTLNPDGTFNDDERARRRGFSWCGRQRPDGTSVGRLVATAQLRAELDAWFAKFAAPGMCNPADQSPTVTGEPTQDVIDRDSRSYSQRNHDALSALVRASSATRNWAGTTDCRLP